MNARAIAALALLAAATPVDDAAAEASRLKTRIREGFTEDPMGSVLATVAGFAYLFYLAERGKNPKVKTLNDALVYVSTNLSVGYCDILARTEPGKLIGSLLMTYGPAMAAKIFDAPRSARDPPAPGAPEVQKNGSVPIATSKRRGPPAMT